MVNDGESTPSKGGAKRCNPGESTRVQKDFDIGIGGIVKIQNAIAGPLQQLLINDQLIMHLY